MDDLLRGVSKGDTFKIEKEIRACVENFFGASCAEEHFARHDACLLLKGGKLEVLSVDDGHVMAKYRRQPDRPRKTPVKKECPDGAKVRIGNGKFPKRGKVRRAQSGALEVIGRYFRPTRRKG